ncbi:MAG: hypothetical protein AABZ32_05090 [Bacteroidota bacterium]
MKKITTLFLISLSILAAGCSVKEEKFTSSTSSQKVIQSVSQETLNELSKIQGQKNEQACSKFAQENIRQQCKETIRRNKELQQKPVENLSEQE